MGYMYPQGYICLFQGVLSIEEQNIFAYNLFPNIYTYQSILLSKIICLWLNISMDNHVKCIVIGNRTGTCASVEMLKGYTLICRNAVGVHGKRKVGNP